LGQTGPVTGLLYLDLMCVCIYIYIYTYIRKIHNTDIHTHVSMEIRFGLEYSSCFTDEISTIFFKEIVKR
jgi:hypothetical protein